MTIDTTAAPGAAASTAAPDTSATNPGLATPADTTTDPNAAAEPASQEDEHTKAARKLERRVGTVTRQRYEAEARARAAEDRAQRAEAALQEAQQRRTPPADTQAQGDPQGRRDQQPQQPQQRTPTREEFDAEVTRQAEHRVHVESASRRANEIFDAGRKTFGDAFGDAARVVQEEAGPLYQRNGLPTALGEAVQDADDPAALLNFLGQNPDDAAELRGLGPAALGRRIAKLEAQLASAPQATKPPTHKPVPGGGTPRSKSDSEMSDAEWAAQRKAKR